MEPLKLSDAGDEHLRQTLVVLGVPPNILDAEDWQVLARADPSFELMGRVYGELNDDLRTLITRGPMEITHITGEARVLVDPAHRNVIADNWSAGATVTIACRQPDEGVISDAASFIAAQKARWSGLSWMDLIDVLGMAAAGAIALYVLSEEAAVHYSTYGADRLLLQEKHPHPTERKAVWYLRSAALVEFLRPLTDARIRASTRIPPGSFEAVLRWLYSRPIFPIINALDIRPETQGSLEPEDAERLVDMGIVKTDPEGKMWPCLTPLPVVPDGPADAH